MEVLVTVFVLSIGMLGMAALQTQSLRWSTDAYSRSQATTLAYDIIDRMRANRDDVDQYVAADLNTLFNQRANCDPTVATVTNDLLCWLRNVDDALPGAVPTIAANAADASMVDVTLTWADREPREFAGEAVPRLPNTADECRDPDGDGKMSTTRQWVNNACMVAQVWTVQP